MKIPVTRLGLLLFHRIGLHIALSRNAAQRSFSGQASQSGFCGTHCKAPNSIMAWLCCPAYRGSITKPASSVKAFFPLGVSIGVSTANRREALGRHSRQQPDTAGSIQKKRWPPPYIPLSLSKRSHPHSVLEIFHRNAP